MSPSHYISMRNIEGQPEYMYTHSYLGNGLMSARRSILMGNFSVEESSQIQQTLLKNPSHSVRSSCLGSLGNSTYIWNFDHNHFHVTFDNSYEDPFLSCYFGVKQFVLNSHIDQPEELLHRQIVAVSYFYDRMKDIRVVKQDSATVKVRDFFHYAENVCNGMMRFRKQSPFLCMDLVYIASYLHDGLGLPLHMDIQVSHSISIYFP